MVKNLISTLLSKKEGASEKQQKKEDIPDELPSLAEDQAEISQSQKEADKPKTSQDDKTKEDTPNELPLPDKGEKQNITASDAPETLPELGSEPVKDEEPIKGDKKEIPEELLSLQEEKAEKNQDSVKDEAKEPESLRMLQENKGQENKEGIEEPIHKVEPQKVGMAQSPQKDAAGSELPKQQIETQPGFFTELISITKEKGINENILNQDLFKRMKEYWEVQHQDKRKTKSKEKLQKVLMDELSMLKKLEESWVTQKNLLEKNKRALEEKAKEIKSKSEKLQSLLYKLSFFDEVDEKKAFMLSSGLRVRSIYELKNMLELIDDKTFESHINENKNDFSDWIKDSVGDRGLAEKIKNLKLRKEVLGILENELNDEI